MNIKKIILSLFFTMISSITFAGDILPADKVTKHNFEEIKEACSYVNGKTFSEVETLETGYKINNWEELTIQEKIDYTKKITTCFILVSADHSFQNPKSIVNISKTFFDGFKWERAAHADDLSYLLKMKKLLQLTSN